MGATKSECGRCGLIVGDDPARHTLEQCDQVLERLADQADEVVYMTKPPPPLGTKFDGMKDRWDLLPWREVGEVVKVLTHGAVKYSDDNWKHVDNLRGRYLAAAHRHLAAWTCGERNDRESGLSHLAHAVCCLFFLMWADTENKR